MGIFHLKYRPRKIKELDCLRARERLSLLLASKNRPQTWLFAGPRGAGKTSAARILARHLNCLSLEGIEPCGKCEVCKQIESGAGVDVIEMDGASNRGIDDVRALKENVHLAPISFKYKVFIIDEVHMMTREAFNALLKILEEPPLHVVFVLCTTDPEKIPVTVLSRLTRIDFYKGSREEVVSSLKKVVEGEKVKVEKGVLEKLAGAVDGSFRDAHKMFSILLSEGKGKIKKEDLDKFLGRSGLGREKDFLRLVSKGKGKKKEILLMVQNMADGGVNFPEFRQNLLKSLEEELVFLVVGSGEGLDLDLGEERVCFLIECLLEAGGWEKKTVLSELPLILAVFKFFEEKKEVLKEGGGGQKEVEKRNEKKEEARKEEKTFKEVEKEEVKTRPVFDKGDLKRVQELWPKVLLAVRPHNHSVEAFLRASRPLRVEGDRIVIEVFYQFHRDRLEDERNRSVVEKGLADVLGQEYKLFCELGDISRIKRQAEKVVVSKKPKGSFKKEGEVESVGEEKKDDLYKVAKELFG